LARRSKTDEALAIAEGRQYAVTGAGRMIREAAGLSLGDVARAIGTDAATVYRWENGHKRPSAPFAVAYRDFLEELREIHAAPRRRGGRRKVSA
jgi:DNA-binding transcriptional regulator YiaG